MKIFETVSFHIVKPCNMKCKFCYATFEDMHVGPQISVSDAKSIVVKLFASGVEKITFAGGEPLMYKHIKEIIRFSKHLGITTSIITNGSLLTEAWLSEMMPYLDWVGLSVDSLNDNTNLLIGRKSFRGVNYLSLVGMIKDMGYRLKINTVVNRWNADEDMNDFISWAKPDRWKVFQTLPVKGQNDQQFEDIKCLDSQYLAFISRHGEQVALVPEDNQLMTGSYLLIDPIGRMFENSKGEHTYSDSLIENTVEHCLSQINLNREVFEARGGIYSW